MKEATGQLIDELGSILIGILVTGSAASGDWRDGSDIDLQVITHTPWKQRRCFRRCGILIDVFIRPEHDVSQSFLSELSPVTLRQFASGSIILDHGETVGKLVQKARQLISQPAPRVSETIQRNLRRGALHLVEDSLILEKVDPLSAHLTSFAALHQIIIVYNAKKRRFNNQPRRVLSDISLESPALGEKMCRIVDTRYSLEARLRTLTEVALQVVKVGFGDLGEFRCTRFWNSGANFDFLRCLWRDGFDQPVVDVPSIDGLNRFIKASTGDPLSIYQLDTNFIHALAECRTKSRLRLTFKGLPTSLFVWPCYLSGGRIQVKGEPQLIRAILSGQTVYDPANVSRNLKKLIEETNEDTSYNFSLDDALHGLASLVDDYCKVPKDSPTAEFMLLAAINRFLDILCAVNAVNRYNFGDQFFELTSVGVNSVESLREVLDTSRRNEDRHEQIGTLLRDVFGNDHFADWVGPILKA